MNTKNNKRSYTKKEDAIIINEVKNYPTNLLHAFSEASKKLTNRKTGAISTYWYSDLRKNVEVNAITCGSEKGFTQNVKNILRNEDNNLPDQGLKHYLYIVKELLDLPDIERKLVINLFTGNTVVKQ